MTWRQIAAALLMAVGVTSAAPSYANPDNGYGSTPEIQSSRKQVRKHHRVSRDDASRYAGCASGKASTDRKWLVPKARAVLGKFETKFGSLPLASTCRPGARMTKDSLGRTSYHAKGMAFDIRAKSVAQRDVIASWSATHCPGLTMTYGERELATVVHCDVGSWHARRGPKNHPILGKRKDGEKQPLPVSLEERREGAIHDLSAAPYRGFELDPPQIAPRPSKAIPLPSVGLGALFAAIGHLYASLDIAPHNDLDLGGPTLEPELPLPDYPPPIYLFDLTDDPTKTAYRYLMRTARIGGTMASQGVELAIGRLHPEFAKRLAGSIKEARSFGIGASIYSAYRPPFLGIGGFSNKFCSLHAYGLAVDMAGIGRPNSGETKRWNAIAARHKIYAPYGIRHRREWNHYQPTFTRALCKDPIRQTITAHGPKNLSRMWEVGNRLLDKGGKANSLTHGRNARIQSSRA